MNLPRSLLPANPIHPGFAALFWSLLPPMLVLGIYIPAMFNGFVWDDWVALVEIPFMTRNEQEWLLLGGTQIFSANFFRPVTTLVLLLEHWFLEPYPVFFHLTNIALHVSNTLLLTLIARRFFRVDTGAFNTAALAVPLLYGLHPALVEPVAWIAGRVDLLVTFFLLQAIWLDMVVRRNWVRALLVAMAYLCALLSKEMAAPFPLVLMLWHLSVKERPLRPIANWWAAIRKNGDLAVYIALSCTAVLYLVARYAVLGHLLVSEASSSDGIATLWERVLLVGAAYGEILRIASGPLTNQLPLHFLDLPLTLASNHVLPGLVILAAIPLYLLGTRLRIPALGWLWLVIPVALLPVSNLIPIRTGPGFMAERFMAFPFALASLVVVATCAAARDRFADGHPPLRHTSAAVLFMLACIWLSAAALAVHRQIPRWENDLALWRWSATVLPGSGYAQLNLVYALKGSVRYAEAIETCRAAIGRVEEKYVPDLRRNLGYLYLATGQPAAAVTELEVALALYAAKPDAAVAQVDVLGQRRTATNSMYVTYLNLGNALMDLQRDTAALEYFERARNLEPEEPAAHYNIGLFHFEHDNPGAAISHFEKALELYQATRKGRHNQLYVMRGIADTEKMLTKARQAQRSN